MSDHRSLGLSRRRILKYAAALGLVGPASCLAQAAQAQKQPKKRVDYQDSPHGDQQCSACIFFLPPENGGMGTCKAVAGDISPHGWCTLFQAKA